MSARSSPRERTLVVRGRRLAYRQWGEDHEFPLLALHGWLDNAASFDALGPLLEGHRVIALDLPGNGLSEHRGPDASYNIWDDLPDLVGLTQALGLSRYALLGHSRGAAIATLLAAIEAPAVSTLVLLDGMLAPMFDPAQTVQQLREFAHDYGRRTPREGKRFASPAEAVKARVTATGIDARAAVMLTARSLRREQDGGWRWRTDGRLRYSSALKLAEDNVRAVLGALELPALLLMATGGMGPRLQARVALGWHAGLEAAELEGCHHFHMLEQAPAIVVRIREFWRNRGQG